MENNKIKITLTTLIIIIILSILCIAGITIFILRHENKPIKTINENNIDENSIKENNIEETSYETIEIKKQSNDEEKIIKQTEGVTVVPTMSDIIAADSSWCGTFQLVWNDLKNEVVKTDIVFQPQLEMVKNLNKEDFNETMLSEDYYFKIYGLKSLELKKQIENGIREKFNQTSDILDDFDWTEDGLNNPDNENAKRYFFYTMLYRKFEFLQEFDKLNNDKFGTKYKDIEYFGIDTNTKNSVGDQIEVLYYNSKDDFAIVINTKSDDEVIFSKSPKGSNFNEIYDNMNNEASKYKGSKSFQKVDEFKAPKLAFKEKKEYDELANKPFKTADPVYSYGIIKKAIQSIEFSLDEKGGKVKSEAAIDAILVTSVGEKTKEDEPRYFYVDDTFAIFLKEKGKTKPYFAGRVEDITKFQ